MNRGTKFTAILVCWITIINRLCGAETSSYLDIADVPYSNNVVASSPWPSHLTDGDYSENLAHSGDTILSFFMIDLMVERTIKSVFISNRGFGG